MKGVLGYYVIVKKLKEKEKTIGVMEIPEDTDTDIKYIKGEVVGVGDLVEGVKVGDTVMYDKHSAKGVSLDNELLSVLRCSKIQNDIAIVL